MQIKEAANRRHWQIFNAVRKLRSLESSLIPGLPESKIIVVQGTSRNRERPPLATCGFAEVWLRCPIDSGKHGSCRAIPAGARHAIGASETGISLGRLPPGRACLRLFRRLNFNSDRPNSQPLDIGVCLQKSTDMTQSLDSSE